MEVGPNLGSIGLVDSLALPILLGHIAVGGSLSMVLRLFPSDLRKSGHLSRLYSRSEREQGAGDTSQAQDRRPQRSETGVICGTVWTILPYLLLLTSGANRPLIHRI